MDETIKAIQTRDGPRQIDYNALANKPTIPSLAPYRTAAAQDVIDAGKIDTDMSVTATGLSAGAAPTVSYDAANNRLSFGIPKGDTGATGAQGPQGIQGVPGTPGRDGQDGAPGRDGQDGADGADGQDGHSPIVTAEKSGTVTLLKIDGVVAARINDGADGLPGTDGQDGADGITPTIGNNGNWYLGSTDTGKPSRGQPGQDGAPGTPGADGQDGADGYSPAVTVATVTGGHRVTITDKTHPSGQSFDVQDGEDGTPGTPGADGITPTIGNNGNWYLGSTDTGKPSRGEPGEPGSDAEVTAANIEAALGYVPADEEELDGKIEDAPSDGKQYARKDGAWTEVMGGGGSGAYVSGETLIFTAAVVSGETLIL